eukprot:4226448-Pyramimonas_sp.AAC.1
MAYDWTSAPMMDSPMFQLKQFRLGTESDMHKMHYNHIHTWARDLPACTAEHFFKKLLRFLDPESVQGTTTGIFLWISK